ncbi:MAG TPA: hypothetical protein VL326_32025 [Kofleriaceae bacterium]|jgi:hypothetical protein|nr:hypothetical protein [Kofleriaceae bacterium]
MRALLACLVATLALPACGISDLSGEDEDTSIDGPADGWGTSADPLLMPKVTVDYLKTHKWGMMHLKWHTERRWDLMPASSLDYAKQHGWTRSTLQEGMTGNGIEFLAMHRMMMQMLIEEAPTTKKYFAGWTTPPTDPRDTRDPLPDGATDPFDDTMLMTIDRLENHLDTFTSDDELGRYIETSLRPTKLQPNRRTTDKSAGIHNYIHNRFADPSSKIDVGDPTVNLQNKRFWRLHGWIDRIWTKYRALKGLTDDDPVYGAAMRKAMAEMPLDSKGLGDPVSDPPPAELTKWFENNP